MEQMARSTWDRAKPEEEKGICFSN